MQQTKCLLNQKNAVIDTLDELGKMGYRYEIGNQKYLNKGRYCMVFGTQGHKNIAILLKTEPYHQFGVKFSDYGEKGWGESVNCKELSEFIRNDIKLVYIKYRSGELYIIPLIYLLNNSHKWEQKELTWVRSFSMSKLIRVN